MQVEIEHKTVSIVIDENMQAEMDKLTADGWMLIPDIKPVAIYQLVRAKGAQATTHGIGAQLKIDDSKVGILRGGKLHYPDGRVVDAT